MSCEHCISGVTHEGTPTGKFEEIGGVRCYVATPAGDNPQDKVLLYLTDVFGVDLVNAQLLIDDFARNGFKTIAPDYLSADPVPLSSMTGHMDWKPGFDIYGWLDRHKQEHTRPSLDKVINALKEQGVKVFGATGYCFGARYVFDLAFDHIISAGAVSHAAGLHNPADFEKYLSTSKAPLLIVSCSNDFTFPLEFQQSADEVFGNGRFAPGYKREHFEGCTHGFAVRGDLSDPKVKEGKEGAFREVVEWMGKYL